MIPHDDIVHLVGVHRIGREEIGLARHNRCRSHGESTHEAFRWFFVHDQISPTQQITSAFGGGILHAI